MEVNFIAGIDEAGRGPLAGPVSVGLVVIPRGFKHPVLKRAKDSKMLSESMREEIFKDIKKLHKEEKIFAIASLVHCKTIDTKGIVYAIKLAIKRNLKKVDLVGEDVRVLLDGSLKAPEEFIYQKTIIKGDQKEKVIGLASIMAKVTRDRWMKKVAKKYPEYGLEIHKGYGTKKHRDAIKKYGASLIHRKSFLKNG